MEKTEDVGVFKDSTPADISSQEVSSAEPDIVKVLPKAKQISVGRTESCAVLENNEIKITGPKGNLAFKIPSGISAKVEDGKVIVSQTQESDKAKALSGLVRASIANMVKGVSLGFSKKLELTGVGYRAQASENNLTLSKRILHY